MRAQRALRLLAVIVALALLGWLLLPGAQAPGTGRQTPALPAFLPPEAVPVIDRIQRGERFAHRQDGRAFGQGKVHRVQRLPDRPRGYYREYTVPTPGLSHRGARRIVTGGDPPSEWYYTDDHYDSFRAFQPATGAGP